MQAETDYQKRNPKKQIQTAVPLATGCIGKTLDGLEGKPMPPPFPDRSRRTNKITNKHADKYANKQTTDCTHTQTNRHRTVTPIAIARRSWPLPDTHGPCKLLVLLPRKGLGEQIGRVLAGVDIVVVHHPLRMEVSAVVVANVDMLRPCLRDACRDMSEGAL